MSAAQTQTTLATGAFEGIVGVRHEIYRSEDDGYAVLEVICEESGDEFTVIGPVGHLKAGDRAEVRGEWQEHSRYGPQVRASGAKPIDPADREGQIAYLTSLRNIGPARAERLRDDYGAAVLDAIAADPAGTFRALSGVSEKQAEAAAESWYASRAVRDLHVRLAPHGLAHLAAPIHARYGADAMRVLHEDPYSLTEVDGVGFARADAIALAADVPPESDRRAQAAGAYVLGEAERQGHTYLPVAELRRRAAELLGTDPDPDVLVAPPASCSRRAASTVSPRTPPSCVARRRCGPGQPPPPRSSTRPAPSLATASPPSSGRRSAAPSPPASR